MKTLKTILGVAAVLLAGSPAFGFGLVAEGQGNLVLDSDNLEGPAIFDFGADNLPDLVTEDGVTVSVLDLAGTVLWSATLDTLALCPQCGSPSGQWYAGFRGFFDIEPGIRDAVITYDYYDFSSYENVRGVLIVSTQTGTVRHQLPGLDLETAVDLDGDDLVELVCSYNDQASGAHWQIWGSNGTTATPAATAPVLRVGQNRPNPFNPRTTVTFELAQPDRVAIEVHDARGRLLGRYELGSLPAGSHDFTWDGVDLRGRPVAAGLYFYTVVAGQQRAARKMLLVR